MIDLWPMWRNPADNHTEIEKEVTGHEIHTDRMEVDVPLEDMTTSVE